MRTSKEARIFYNSQEWIDTRNAYVVSKGGMCERCDRPGGIVHHRRRLDASNVSDWETACGFENLELLCTSCHNKEHGTGDKTKRDGMTWGRLVG